MNNLKEIKTKSLEIFEEGNTVEVLDFLLSQIEPEETHLYSQVLLLQSRKNGLEKQKNEELISKEDYHVKQNRLKQAVLATLLNLDTPDGPTLPALPEKKIPQRKLLYTILIFQVLILVSIWLAVALLRA